VFEELKSLEVINMLEKEERGDIRANDES